MEVTIKSVQTFGKETESEGDTRHVCQSHEHPVSKRFHVSPATFYSSRVHPV